MFSHRSLRLGIGTFALVPLLVLAISPPWERGGEHRELFVATSADDAFLRTRIAALSPTVSPDDARRVAYAAYMTGVELRRKWRVVWLPGVQNLLVNMGARKGGLCFQWATELLVRLDALKLQTLELHWAESFANTSGEHNVIVVTAQRPGIRKGRSARQLALLGTTRLDASRHGSGVSLDGKQVRTRPQIGENKGCSFEASAIYDEIELKFRRSKHGDKEVPRTRLPSPLKLRRDETA